MKNFFLSKNNWTNISSVVILAASICIASILYYSALALPIGERIRGDAQSYLIIASSFTSFSDAMAYVTDRTYGFPLFLYLIKRIFSPTLANVWALEVSYIQFSIHILACLSFYQFFLKKLFQKTNLAKISATLTAGIIITYPVLITYTTTPLTDVFCADLMMFVAAIYASLNSSKKWYWFVLNSLLCGLILGYTILVRPSFWPPVIAFYCGILIEAFINRTIRKKIFFKAAIMCFGASAFLIPEMNHVWEKYHSIGIQDPIHFKNEENTTLQDGLAGVRIFWSKSNSSFKYHPGTYDVFLKTNYYYVCTINSFKDWVECLFSKPSMIPIYFWKKTMALFDVPNIQPYAVDITPGWFICLERIFGMLAFCGFISFILITITNFFIKIQNWFCWPFILFITTSVLQHSLGHVEGRFVFSTIPFLIAALFLGFINAKQINRFFLTAWICAIMISGVSFLYQTYAWDLVPTI